MTRNYWKPTRLSAQHRCGEALARLREVPQAMRLLFLSCSRL